MTGAYKPGPQGDLKNPTTVAGGKTDDEGQNKCEMASRDPKNGTDSEGHQEAKQVSHQYEMPLSERFKIFNSIDQFRPFQVELMEKLAELKRVAVSIGTGIGKTTMIKYICLDFIDLDPKNKCLILVNTRALTYDISESIREIFDTENNEAQLLCNLNEHDSSRPLTKSIAEKARIFIGVPDKYVSFINKLPKTFNFVCIDEVDALIDRETPEKSSILHIINTITFTYSLVCSATFSEDVYNYIIYKYGYSIKEFNEPIPKISISRISYDKYDKYWHTYVCDKIHHIILENPLMNKVIVFCNYRNDCDRLYNDYKMCGSQPNFCIHGNMDSLRIQELFKSYKASGKVLFTTDMCQRGLDVKDIDIIFHIGVTGDTDFYHRNGRTLRKSGAEPICFLFVQNHELQKFPNLNEFPEKKFESNNSGPSFVKYKYASSHPQQQYRHHRH